MMEEVHMFLNGEHFAWTETPTEVIDAMECGDCPRITIPIEGMEQTLKVTIIRDGDNITLNMQRIH